MTGVVHIHDAFFKAYLSESGPALDFLEAYLPVEIMKALDRNSLRLSNKSFVDESLKSLHSDLIYECKINGSDSYVYILLEHQSVPDKFMPFRLLKYAVGLWQEHFQKKGVLPQIYPVCVYNGKISPYPYSLQLQDCFESLLTKNIYFLSTLVDLTSIPDEVLSKQGKVSLFSLLLKHVYERDLVNFFLTLCESGLVFEQFLFKDPEGKRLFLLSTRYIFEAKNLSKAEGDQLMKNVQEAADQKQYRFSPSGYIEYYASKGWDKGLRAGRKEGIERGIERGIEKGIERGIEKGVEKAFQLMAQRMIQKGHSLAEIQEITELSLAELRSLKKKQN